MTKIKQPCLLWAIVTLHLYVLVCSLVIDEIVELVDLNVPAGGGVEAKGDWEKREIK